MLLILFEIVDDVDGVKQVQDMDSRFVEWDQLISTQKPVVFVVASSANCEVNIATASKGGSKFPNGAVFNPEDTVKRAVGQYLASAMNSSDLAASK